MADRPTLVHRGDHRAHRGAAYPPFGDALDAIAAGFRALREQGLSLPPETIAWLDACAAVKARIRKPEETDAGTR